MCLDAMDNKKWKAQQDMHDLSRAAEIMKDKKRVSSALKAAKEEQKKVSAVVAHLSAMKKEK